MNPLALVGMALVGLLAVYLFIGKSNEQHSEQLVRQAKHELEVKKFDRDFAGAWNGEKIAAPAAGEIDAQAGKVQQLEADAEHQRQETKARTEEMQKALDEMAEYKKKETGK